MGCKLRSVDTMLLALITAGVSATTALLAVFLTYLLTRRREHETDWRKVRLEQYQNFMLALSEITEGRSTSEAMRHYTDALNSLSLVAPIAVLRALRNFQDEISCRNVRRTDEAHDRLLNVLIREMRRDIHPSTPNDDSDFKFHLLGFPHDARRSEIRPSNSEERRRLTD